MYFLHAGQFSIYPRYGNQLGGTAIAVCVPLVTENDTIECTFEDTVLPGIYVNDQTILCVSPRFPAPGSIKLGVIIFQEETIIFQEEGSFYVCK